MNNVLEVKNLSKTFYSKNSTLEVLKDISFTLKEKEIIAIVGPSGSGKTTLLNIITGLLKPTSGEVIINGEIGYMFQRDHLFEWRTIWKNLTIGLEIQKKADELHFEKIRKLLKKYQLEDFIKSFPSELSGGMRQRIALIRTLSVDANILLLDEAFSALDYQTRLKVSNDIYHMIRDENLSAILVTHDINEAISLADRVIVMSNRPAAIKNIYEIEYHDLDPLSVRIEKDITPIFNKIWNDLNE